MADEIKKEDWSVAIESLKRTKQELIEKHKRMLAELDAAIANLEHAPQKRETIPQGSYKGLTISAAVQAFLVSFGGPVKFESLVRALVKGGVRLGDPEKPNRYAANVKTTIVANRKRFHYDKRRDTVRLIIQNQQHAAAGG